MHAAALIRPASAGSESTLPETASGATETPAVHDDETIVGFWRGIDALADGDPSANDIGAIYEFRCDNPLWIVSSEYEGLQEYRMDSQTQPPTLVRWFLDPQKSGSGIYQFFRNSLRIRSARDRQDLQFRPVTPGRWWEHRFVRITVTEAEGAIEAIQQQRLASDP